MVSCSLIFPFLRSSTMLAAVIAVSALQLLAAASPFPLPDGVQRIALTRSQQQNNTVPPDLKELADEVGKTLFKHIVGLQSYQENVGQVHPLASVSDTTSRNIYKRGDGFVSIQSGGAGLWTGIMEAGTPAQRYRVGFDTGSASLVLLSSTCTSSECQSHPRYNPTTSRTSVDRRKQFNLKITDSDSVMGDQYADTISVGGLTAAGQVFGAANRYPASFKNFAIPPDGRMGLAYQAISAYNAYSVPQTLIAQGLTSFPVFSIYLGPTTPYAVPEILFGDIDFSAIRFSTLTYTPVTSKGFWQIALDSVQAGSNQQTVGCTAAIIDTGSSLIIGDRVNVDKLYATIPGSRDIGGGMYTVPCASIPIITLTIGGTAIPINPDYFNQGPVSVGSSQCVGGIAAAPQTSPPRVRYWTIGDVFLRGVYSVFDFGENRVGFAPNRF
ncbi:aspartic peptidase domain-containing protein [Cristinia sonorae]|uniref:Aspartic peptidase domain-containing protein n=1 Tax=Cristinia sonorae TaxID=1940300 RepID=A0A8K0UGA5_9AGAR|nr:aspartic peptidase domain-containing protein [Cristinia sonorae]